MDVCRVANFVVIANISAIYKFTKSISWHFKGRSLTHHFRLNFHDINFYTTHTSYELLRGCRFHIIYTVFFCARVVSCFFSLNICSGRYKLFTLMKNIFFCAVIIFIGDKLLNIRVLMWIHRYIYIFVVELLYVRSGKQTWIRKWGQGNTQ